MTQADRRLCSSVASFQRQFLRQLTALHGISLEQSSPWQQYTALAAMVRELTGQNWQQTRQRYQEQGAKQVYYLSIEFLLGRLLGVNLLSLGLYDIAEQGLRELGLSLAELEQQEPDAGLGNGGLGRLAACYLDSMAAGGLPGQGCGLRYTNGLFVQRVIDGEQVEYPDPWLRDGYVWEYRRPDQAITVNFGCGQSAEQVVAVPYDVPVLGFQNQVVNTLRLWSAEAAPQRSAHLLDKPAGSTSQSESITASLYPDDSTYEGKIFRLKQQYLLVAASLAAIFRDYQASDRPITELASYVAIHINDTHPALAVPELMRLLIDQEGLPWDTAWTITVDTLSYTNHTVMPEALEKWPVELFRALLPRIFDLVHAINEKFCCDLWNRYPGQWDKIAQMAIIADGQVHMAHLAIVGCHSVNGVAKLHTEILKKQVMKNFAETEPAKFNNKTNGISHRRWLLKANPGLSRLITNTIGPDWVSQPDKLADLAGYADDAAFCQAAAAIKRQNKGILAKHIRDHVGITVAVDSVFDVQIKRMHAYKRQLLNALHILHLYNRLKAQPDLDMTPHTFIFGGKAAAGYYEAKQTIKFINALAAVINQDRTLRDKLKVVFLENYNVSLAELIIPAADVSEQISTAGKEASGTGNMKLMLNGAVTIGTLDGANVEISEAVGEDNIFLFGLTAAQVADYQRYGGYSPWELYQHDERIKRVLEQLKQGFMPGTEFASLYHALLDGNDPYFVLKDFAAYADAHARLAMRFNDSIIWQRMTVRNMAQAGQFAIDRTFGEYARDIWAVSPVLTARTAAAERADSAKECSVSIFMQ
ncbi:glycogen/starch/alpha-glucan phosphorylase [bacterium BFN5]|nr:glycogen/starch/alpha-glucan phosphorylase [bacterium BFN5]QJW48917.1 glycogen/starch/alpha-glucan phosphorylase [bacterium BFN5]